MVYVTAPTGGLYLTGGLALVIAIQLLRRWLLGAKGRLPRQSRYVLVASIIVFVLGSAMIGAAIAIDIEQARIQNTRTFSYWVTVHPNGTVPVRLLLPAPLDERVFPALNQTVGTSTLRLNQTGAQPSVEIVATENVSFETHIEFVGDPISTELSRVSPINDILNNASVELSSDSSGSSSALVQLSIIIGEYCVAMHFNLDAVVHEGVAEYPISHARSVC